MNKNKSLALYSKNFQITGHQGPIYALCQDPQYIYSASADKFVARWHKSTGQQDHFAIRCMQAPFSLCVLSAQQHLAIGLSDGSIHLIDTTAKVELKFLKAHEAAVFAIATNPAHEQHYSADAEGNLLVWDYQWDLLLNLPFSCGKIRQIIVAPDGSYLLLAGADGYFRKIDTTYFNEMHQTFAHQEGCTALCILPSGDILSAGKDAYIRRWSASGEKLNAFPAHLGTIYQLLALADGNYVSASRDKSIKIWDQNNDQIQQKLDLQMAGHRHSINALIALENGFASAGDDKRILLWHAQNPKTP
jgi:WD40 repeat protein